MGQIILWEIAVLALVVFVFMGSMLYLFWRFMDYQRRVLTKVSMRLQKIEGHLSVESKRKKRIETAIAITKDEKMAKYREVQLPDDIKISFVDKEEKR